MNLSPPRDLNPRIRILSCEPLPEPKRQVSLRPAAGLIAVAVVGLGAWWALRPSDAPLAVSVAPVAAAPAQAHGSVSAAHYRTTRYVHARMREAVDVDFAEAADVAQRRERVVRQAPGTYLPSVTPLAAPPTQTWATGSEAVSSVPQRAPRTAAPPQTSVTVIEDSGTARAPAEGPQSPGDPGAPAPSD